MDVEACLHVYVSKTGKTEQDGENRFSCGAFHTFHTYRCEFAPGELILHTTDKEGHSFRNLMLVESPHKEEQLEGYSENSNVPAVLFRFADKTAMRGFADLACIAACTIGHREKNQANQVDEPVAAVLRVSGAAVPHVPHEDEGDVADLYPVDGLTKLSRNPHQ
jgi:hypothetical protein